MEKLVTLIEGVSQVDLSGLVNALKLTKTWGEPVVKELSKLLIQGGASVQKAINCSTDSNLNLMGASLPTQRMLENVMTGTVTSWFSAMKSDEKKSEMK